MPLPPPLANLSVWQRTVRDDPLLSVNNDAPLPQESDIVIIGGGLCGAVVAHALLYPEEHGFPPSRDAPKITLLEARELASGASGRNAGHCRPDAARGFPTFAAIHGDDQARHILQSEREVFNRVDAFIKRHDISCEWNPRSTYDIFLSPEFAAHSTAAAEAYANAGGTVEQRILSPEDAASVFPTTSHGAAEWPAATINPAKLALAVFRLCLAKGDQFAAYAHTPVTGVEGKPGEWSVSTPRGVIRTPKVVFATNAYGGHALESLIAPLVAQAQKLSPGPALSGSYSLRYSSEVFFSVAPRPDGSVVLGASLGSGPSKPGVDDSAWCPAVAQRALDMWEKLLPGDRVHLGESAEAELAKASTETGTTDVAMKIDGVEGLEYAWRGIIGFTPDMVPLVGDVPGRKGQYVAAGYCGHGMARIFVTAPALAQYVRTGEWDAAMPSCFRVTPERLARLQRMEMPAAVRRARGL